MTRSFLVVGAAFATLLIASAAFGARGFSDPGGDTNTAPDLASLEIAEASAGTIAIKIVVANYQALPANSWFNLWFDVDANASTGDDAGDEALVRYQSVGAMELYTWNGAQYVAGSVALKSVPPVTLPPCVILTFTGFQTCAPAGELNAGPYFHVAGSNGP